MRRTVRTRSIAILILTLCGALMVYGLQRGGGDGRAEGTPRGQAPPLTLLDSNATRLTRLPVDWDVDAEARPTAVLSVLQPDPPSSETVIRFALERRSHVDLSVFDAWSREVAILAHDQVFEAGTHRVVWKDGTTPAGAGRSSFYFIRLRTDSGEWNRPLVRLP